MGDLVTGVPLMFTLTPLYRTCHILTIKALHILFGTNLSFLMTPIYCDLLLALVVLGHLQKRANEPHKKKLKKFK